MCKEYLGKASVMAKVHSWWWEETPNCLCDSHSSHSAMKHSGPKLDTRSSHSQPYHSMFQKLCWHPVFQSKSPCITMQSVFSPSGKPAPFEGSSWCSHWETDWALSLRDSEMMTSPHFLFCTLNLPWSWIMQTPRDLGDCEVHHCKHFDFLQTQGGIWEKYLL